MMSDQLEELAWGALQESLEEVRADEPIIPAVRVGTALHRVVLGDGSDPVDDAWVERAKQLAGELNQTPVVVSWAAQMQVEDARRDAVMVLGHERGMQHSILFAHAYEPGSADEPAATPIGKPMIISQEEPPLLSAAPASTMEQKQVQLLGDDGTGQALLDLQRQNRDNAAADDAARPKRWWKRGN